MYSASQREVGKYSMHLEVRTKLFSSYLEDQVEACSIDEYIGFPP